jgi:hypothetical protein
MKLGEKQEKTVSLELSKNILDNNAIGRLLTSELELSTNSELLGSIYKMLLISDRLDIDEQIDMQKQLKSERDLETKHNKEIIRALTGRKKNPVKETVEKKEKKTETKTKKTTEEKNVKPGGTATPAGKTPTTPTTPTNTPVTPTSPVGTAVKVITGGALVTSAAAIGAAESGGNYDITFGDTVDKKSGKIKNLKGYPTPEELFGKKLTDMTLSEVKEFGQIRSAKSPSSGASGKYQFMPSTLFGRVGKDGKLRPGLVQQLGLSMDTKFTPQVQDKLQELLHTQDVATLKRLGVPITPGYEYMAHYIGARGASAVHKSISKGENVTVAQALVNDGLQEPGPNNKELYQIKVNEFEKILEQRLVKKGGLTSPHSAGQEVGTKIDSASQENKNLKKSMAQKSGSTTIINNQVNSSSSTSESSGNNFSPDDESIHHKKARE